MSTYKYILLFLVTPLLLASCSSGKNTSGTRWYHSFNTRYNVYFNGDQAFQEALKKQQEGYTENYSETILMFPISATPKDKETTGGAFDRSIEKAVKAIKTHSIQTKPEKKPGKRKDPKYQEFMSRIEYNPFLHNAWMMMAKSQFYNGDFLQAASSFSYISRLYATQPQIANEAKIWQARTYGEMDWHFEAEDILSKIDKSTLNKRQVNWLETVLADVLIKQKRYEEAVPYLQTAIKSEKNKLQRTREKYLLGQIYTSLGEKELAYKIYNEVPKANPPYALEFSARIRQTEVFTGKDTTQVVRQLRKMAKSSKNKDYLDQVYYALGNVYMSVPDTLKAIESYEKGVKESTLNGIDKALNQIQLGDIYFEQREYIQAQPNYSESLSQLKKGDDAYPRVSKRSEVLDELVVFFEAVQLQDSLQRLSKMTPEEQLVVVNKIIEDLIKKEEEELKEAEREEFMNELEESRMEFGSRNQPQAPKTILPPGSENLFYFYNSQAVSVGKNAFQQKWGRRPLEDDWRRRNKVNPMSEMFQEDEIEELNALDDAEGEESELAQAEGENDLDENGEPIITEEILELSSDPKDPQFYLQQIPKTEEDIEASNLIIIDGLFNMGIIYKDKLEDSSLALETFGELDSRFPENSNKLEAYYHTYLIYLKENNMEMANLYKQNIRNKFPESQYAIAMADPNYEYNLRMMHVIQDSLYQATYDAYLNGNPQLIRKNYETIQTKYNQTKLMPKFMFLNALSYVQTNDADTFKEQLKELITKYPDADVSVLASEMMKGFQRGLLLSASGDGMLARGSLFNLRFGNADDELLDTELVFKADENTPHELLLVYPRAEMNDNLLLYTVASYNFGNFMVNDFDLERTFIGEVGMLEVKGFQNLAEVMQYVQKINEPDGYGASLQQSVVVVPISLENYATLMKGMSLEEYMDFFEEHFGNRNPDLIERWHLKQADEMETISEETEEVTEEMADEEQSREEAVDEEQIIDEVKEEVKDNLKELAKENPLIPREQDGKIVVVDVNEVFDLQEEEKQEEEVTQEEEKLEEILNDTSKTLDNINDAWNDIATDPVRGIQKLFKRGSKSNAIDEMVKQQEKEEKERIKQLQDEQKEKEKEAKEIAKQLEKEQKEALKAQEEADKALLKEKKKREKELEKLKREEEKAKKEEAKRIEKEKEDERKAKIKAREEERKAKEIARKELQKQKEAERKEKEKAREEARKIREQERKELQKQKEAERKEKAKIREAERKAKEKARKEAQKQREAERKANQK